MSRIVAYRAVMLAGALVAAWLLFWQLTALLLAVILTVIVALPLTAATDRLHAWHIPRPVAATGTMALVVALIVGFTYLVGPTLAAQVKAFVSELPALVDRVRAQLGLATGSTAGFELQAFIEQYFADPGRLLGRVGSVVTTVVAIVGGVLLVIFAAVYAAINPQPLVDGALRIVPPHRRGHARVVMCRVRVSWLGWLKGTAVDMVLTGVLTYVALSVLGLRHALVFSLLTAVLEVVPYLGPILAALAPVLYALTQSIELAALTLVVFTAIQQIEGHVIIPLVMAKTVELHPAVIALGVVIMGQLFGLMGILLAVPLLAAMVILVEEFWVLPHEKASERRQSRPAVPVGDTS